jgi:hypothetical protein
MKNPPPKQLKKSPHSWFPVATMAIVLALLFWRSGLPSYVHFSNDGPLGQISVHWLTPPASYSGMWGDLNGIGYDYGTAGPSITNLLLWILGPVGYAKYLTPITLLITGLGAWTFFLALKFSRPAATIGALAAILNSSFFFDDCWGLGAHEVALGMDFIALALVMANTKETPRHISWARLALAGLCVGMNVMEAADIGALYSLIVATFVFFRTWTVSEGGNLKKSIRSLGSVAMVTAFAGFIAFQSILSLVGGSIQGVSGTAQDPETKARQWDWATQWSLPKKETLALAVPGLFGYKMDTPKDMIPLFTNYYWHGTYCGGVGRDPNVDRFLDKIFQPGDDVPLNFNSPDHPNQNLALKIGPDGNINAPLLGQIKVAGLSGLDLKEKVDQSYASTGNPSVQASVELPGGFMRFAGGQNYCGILVLLVAGWAVAQSLRRQNSLLDETQKKMVWLWFAVLLLSLPLAWGRFAPLSHTSNSPFFYALLYKLPYFSTIRNPVKFLYLLSWAAVILFAFGMNALSRRYLDSAKGNSIGIAAQIKTWWAKAGSFDRKWTWICLSLFSASVIAWLIFSSQKPTFVQYLQIVGYGDKGFADAIASFSITQAGCFLILFATAIALLTLVISGCFAGPRAKLGAFLLGAFLVFDLVRADLPYIIHWDYKQKYEVGTLNPIVEILSDRPYEHRVAKLLPAPLSTPPQFGLFDQLYAIEWMQHHFPYYNIQNLDIIQMSREPEDWHAWQSALRIGIKQDPSGQWMLDQSTFPELTRKWELSNTRYLLGPAAFLELFNAQFDPGKSRFRILQRFGVGIKPGVTEFHQSLEELTAFPNDNGDYALFEFTGALPRAKLYSNWQVNTNDQSVLKTLADLNFDPAKTVLVDTQSKNFPAIATNENTGTVEFQSYTPKHIVLSAKATTPAVLLLNDKYAPNWRVTVDGKPAELLRCNFIMRGVYLPPGEHAVEFWFVLPNKPLYVTLSAVGVGFVLCVILWVSTRRKTAA